MRRIIGSSVVGVIVGGICWFFGLDIASAVVVCLVIVAGGIVWATVPAFAPDRDWPVAPANSFAGGRHETSDLSWTLRVRRGDVNEAVTVRVRAIARTRLAARSLDIDNPAQQPAIEALIGGPAYYVLRPDRGRSVNLATLIRTLDALDTLERPATER
jgi:hypothetical protein